MVLMHLDAINFFFKRGRCSRSDCSTDTDTTQSRPFIFKSPKTILIMAKMKCPCKYTYDPEKGDPKQGIPPGTQFEDLPDTWRCPRCKRKKEKFVPVEE